MALSTGTNSQSQTVTQSPQAGAQSINSGTQTSSLQPEPASSLLNGNGQGGGLNLSSPTLSGVSLTGGSTATTSSSQPATVTPAKHHFKPTLLALPLVLVVVAVVLIWSISRSEKKRRPA